VPRKLEETGALADKQAFLDAIGSEAPKVLRELGALLGRPGDTEEGLRSWAGRWNLARVEHGRERGAWVVAAARKTLRTWARLTHVADPWSRGWSYPTAAGRLTDYAKGILLDQVEDPAATKRLGGFSYGFPRSRDKRRLGDALGLLRTAEPFHLVALVRWQVLNESVPRVAKHWSTAASLAQPPAHSTVLEAMRGLSARLDLPMRPAGKPGRPSRLAE
jgi:hypothetical protein